MKTNRSLAYKHWTTMGMALFLLWGCADSKARTTTNPNPQAFLAEGGHRVDKQRAAAEDDVNAPSNISGREPASSRSMPMQSAEATLSSNRPLPTSSALDRPNVERRADYRKQVAKPRWQGGDKPNDNGGTIEFNFDNANLNEVIRTIAQLLDIKYISDPGIQGTVTIHTAKGLSRKDLFPLFFRILEVNGLVAVKEGQFYRITSSEQASRLPLALRVNTDRRPLPQWEDFITQIIPLEYTSAAEMAKLITPFISTSAKVIPHLESNTLIVVDKGINIMKVLRLVEAFDLNMLTRTNHRFFFLKNGDAENVTTVLKEAFNISASGQKDLGKLIPIKRLNAFMAISSSAPIFDQIDCMLTKLDAASEGVTPRIYVYFVRNGSARNLSDLLTQVFTQAESLAEWKTAPSIQVDNKTSASNQSNPFALKVAAKTSTAEKRDQQPPQQTSLPTPSLPGAGGGSLKSKIKITPDEIRNALIIEATPTDYRTVSDILGRIDVLPRQVLIEATIAEIDHNLSTELGVDWTFLKNANNSRGLLSGSLDGTSGLTLAFGVSDELSSILKALERQNKVNILSSPHVLASDNQKARIDISNEIPLVSSETVVTSGSEPIVTTNIQYRDTGVMLSVTPHINERALVTMDIYQEVSEQSDDVTVAGQSYPSFFKRTVETSLTVRHGQTIVLGGLIRENKSKSTSGLPWLSRIPLIGFLFGQDRDTFDKTELIILLTPRVIVDLNDVDEVTEGFKSKVVSVVESMKGSSNQY